MILATIFVSLPFVVREVVPVLREIGTEQEQAARTLGAVAGQTFWRITLPAIRWGVAYGVVLTTARALGEFGAVAVVSGKIVGGDADAHAARRGAVPAVRPDRRLRGQRGAGARRAVRDPVDEPAAIAAGRRPPDGHRGPQRQQGVRRLPGARRRVAVDVPDGSLTALLGPSGGGKSTLLRVIAGLETADAGEVLFAGEHVTAVAPQQRDVGFVFQHYAAFKHMTVRDNVAFGLKIRKRPKDEIAARVDELLKLVHLDGFAGRYPAQLSGGQRQRMALARALAVEPKVLLLDEPFGALDAKVRKELRDWLRRLHDEVHVTTVFVTHDQEEAMEVAEQIVVINEGRDRAGRDAGRALRAPGDAVRDGLRRAGVATRRTGTCARTTSTLHLEPDRRRAGGADRARRAGRFRGARRSAPRRRRAGVRARHPPAGRRAGARGRSDRLAARRIAFHAFDGGTAHSRPERRA